MNKNIAIVEDEESIRENYRDLFTRQGFRVTVYADRDSALAAFKQRLPDLAIIDIGLGDDVEGGFDLCRELRAMSSQVPIIFLSARDSELDIVSGLRLGADDYLTKETSVAQILARVSALLRRVQALQKPEEPDQTLIRGLLHLNLERMTAHWRSQQVDLTVTEFYLVHALVIRPGHVKSRQQLMDASQSVVDENTVTSHIKRLRKKFIALDGDFDAIKTAYGLGYRWQVNE